MNPLSPSAPWEGLATEVSTTGGPCRSLLTVVTPAYNEAENLPVLYERLSQVIDRLGLDWEWIVIDDHSADETFAVVTELARREPRILGIRLARNSGSHTAIACGLHHAGGDCAVIMAADLQDPPETLPDLLTQWRAGAQVVWALRARREGEKSSTLALARVFYLLMRHVFGFRDMPATGADFFLLDRRVVDAFHHLNERNVSLIALITWMGFRQATITYDKQARLHGRSGWSLGKKLKLALDTVVSFTYLPIRVMSYLGFVVAVCGFLYAMFVFVTALSGHPQPGWSSLMVAVLVIGGIQMLMMGVLGEYLWRALDEARGRPRYLIEATVSRAELGGEKRGSDRHTTP